MNSNLYRIAKHLTSFWFLARLFFFMQLVLDERFPGPGAPSATSWSVFLNCVESFLAIFAWSAIWMGVMKSKETPNVKA
jgi:hypothetical protein